MSSTMIRFRPGPVARASASGGPITDGEVTALVDVSLEIRRGEYVAIMGPSGSGKSTLLNLLGTLDRPTSGEIYFEDQPLSDLRDLDNFRSNKIGFVFQSFYLLPTLTADRKRANPDVRRLACRRRSAFAGPTSCWNRSAWAIARSICRAQLSVGERQRVAIARALANEPPLLLADEPTGNLDSHCGADVLDLFDQLHAERGMTLIVITHSLEVAERAERIVWIRDGRVAEDPVNARPRIVSSDNTAGSR